MARIRNPRPLVIFMGIATALLLGVAVLFILVTLGQRDTNDFKEIQGVVTASRIDQSSLSGRPHSSASFTPLIEYEFIVDSRSYKSNCYTLGTRYVGHSKADAKRELEKHPVGGPITAYYDPEDPTRSVLIRGMGDGEHLVWGLAAFMIAVVAVGWFFTLRRCNTYKSQPDKYKF